MGFLSGAWGSSAPVGRGIRHRQNSGYYRNRPFAVQDWRWRSWDQNCSKKSSAVKLSALKTVCSADLAVEKGTPLLEEMSRLGLERRTFPNTITVSTALVARVSTALVVRVSSLSTT